MMDDFRVDARRWRFLEDPESYIQHGGRLKLAPLKRQFKTTKEILNRLAAGRGVLLADDVGLGKTTIGALVGWIVACQDKRVRIYAPNAGMQRRWAEELERHIPMLRRLGGTYDKVENKFIRQGDVERLHSGYIQVATHHALVKSHGRDQERTACDLMIIDEAHRAKGDGSAFNEALRDRGEKAKRKLILTATPFSIKLTELEQLLQFVGASDLEGVRQYAEDLKRLYSLGEGHDVAVESKRLEGAAKAAIDALQPYLIRHGIDDLLVGEREHFGEIEKEPWKIATPPASPEDIKLLLQIDRILELAPGRKGERRIDPRFHIGWEHLASELCRAEERNSTHTDVASTRHVTGAKKSLSIRRRDPHPKIAATIEAIRPVLAAGEKVLVFCHHRAAASELLSALEKALRTDDTSNGATEKVWREAWEQLLKAKDIWSEEMERPQSYDILIKPVIDWLCTKGLRRQIAGWLGTPATDANTLAEQLSKKTPRGAGPSTPTICDTARTLVRVLLDAQSKSTRAVLRNIRKGAHSGGVRRSNFPGQLDEGFPVMGSWVADGSDERPKTLYTGESDIVRAVFNSPFGPDVLVATDRLSEGVDLHWFCRHVIHYELDPSPVRTLQRNGRVRRIGSWAAVTEKPIRYAYPTFGGTRDEKAVDIMKQRINAFGLLLGGVPSLDENEPGEGRQHFADEVLRSAHMALKSLNSKLCVK